MFSPQGIATLLCPQAGRMPIVSNTLVVSPRSGRVQPKLTKRIYPASLISHLSVERLRLTQSLCDSPFLDHSRSATFPTCLPTSPALNLTSQAVHQRGDTVLEPGLGDQRPFISDDAPPGTVFTIEREERFGGPTHYTSFSQIQDDFKEEKLHPKDLKISVANANSSFARAYTESV